MKRNLFISLASSIWVALVGLAVVPFYLQYLGIEAYGLVGFFVMTQALLQLLDMGLAPALNREVARASVMGDMPGARNLLHTLDVVFWGMAVAIGVSIILLAPVISEYWLQARQLPQDTVRHAVMLMGLVAACRWPGGLYQGALMGMQRQDISGLVNIALLPVGSIGAVCVLAFISPTIEAFFCWQAFAALLYVIVLRQLAWRTIGREGAGKFSASLLRSIWRFSAEMSGVALTGIIFTQLDKVILSKMLDIAQFGYYMLATTVAGSLYLLTMPVFNIMYPRLSALVKEENGNMVVEQYRRGSNIFAALLFSIAMALALFSQDLMLVWTGNPDIASGTGPLIALLAAGTALHGVMYFPYSLQLAYGMTRLPLMINTILMAAQAPLIIFLTVSYGTLGGALAWLVLHMMYLLLGAWVTHRHLLRGEGRHWLFFDIGIPLGVSVVVGILGQLAFKGTEYAAMTNIMWGGGLALAALLLSLAISPSSRMMLLQWIGTGLGHNTFKRID